MPVSPSDRPLQNRCDPFGTLHAVAARGTLMGNRGGRIHDADRRLGQRRWASRRWIACACAFKARPRTIWGTGYTEIFFLDDVTALAAGHRPCFECRRTEAKAFLAAAGHADANALDRELHAQRIPGARKNRQRCAIASLPDGTMVKLPSGPAALRAGRLLQWSFAGYGKPMTAGSGIAEVLTPPLVLAALAAGYRPGWHPSACGQAVDRL